MTLIHLPENEITPGDIAFLAKTLKEGKVLVFPTDTVPGLLADATNSDAVAKIFAIKNRSKSKKLPVFVANIEMAKRLAEISSETKKELVEKWPGQFTFILKRIPYSQKLYGLEDETVALRIPNYKPLNMLLEKVDTPIVQTSANTTGEAPLKNIREVADYFAKRENRPDILVETYKESADKPSTIIDLTTELKKIIR